MSATSGKPLARVDMPAALARVEITGPEAGGKIRAHLFYVTPVEWRCGPREEIARRIFEALEAAMTATEEAEERARYKAGPVGRLP